MFSETQLKFISQPAFAVVGASLDRSKFGNKVLRFYIDHARNVTPIHPKESSIEGISAITSLAQLPDPKTTAVSVVTPPKITLSVIKEAVELGVPAIWLQPDTDDEAVREFASHHANTIIYGGPCILVSGDELLKEVAHTQSSL